MEVQSRYVYRLVVLASVAAVCLLMLAFSPGRAHAGGEGYRGGTGGNSSGCSSCFNSGEGGGGGSLIAEFWELSNVSHTVDWTGINGDNATPKRSDLNALLDPCGVNDYHDNCIKWRDKRYSNSDASWDIHTGSPDTNVTPNGGTKIIVAWNIRVWRLKNPSAKNLPDDASPIFERRVGMNVSSNCGESTPGNGCDTDKSGIYNRDWWLGGKSSSLRRFTETGKTGGPIFDPSSRTADQCADNFSSLGSDRNENRNIAGNVKSGTQRPVRMPEGAEIPKSALSVRQLNHNRGACYWEGSQIGSSSSNDQFGWITSSGEAATNGGGTNVSSYTAKGLRESILISWRLGKRPFLNYSGTGLPGAWYLVQINGITNREELVPIDGDKDTKNGVATPAKGDTSQNYFKLFVPNRATACVAGDPACEDVPRTGPAPDITVSLETDSPLQARQQGRSTIDFTDAGGFTDEQAFFPKLVRLQHFTPQMDYNGAKSVQDLGKSYSKSYVKYDVDMGDALRSIPDPRPGPATTSDGAGTYYYCPANHKVYGRESAAGGSGCSNIPGSSRLRRVTTNGGRVFSVCKDSSSIVFISSVSSATVTPLSASELAAGNVGKPASGCSASVPYSVVGVEGGGGGRTSTGNSYYFLNFARLPQSPKLDRMLSLGGVLSQNKWFTTWLKPTLANPCYSPTGTLDAQPADMDATKPWPTTPAQCHTLRDRYNPESQPGTTRNAWDDYFSARANWEKRWIGEKGASPSPAYATHQSLRCDDLNSSPHDAQPVANGCNDVWHQVQMFAGSTKYGYAQGYLLTADTDNSGYSDARVILDTKNVLKSQIKAAALWNRKSGEIMGWGPNAVINSDGSSDSERSNSGQDIQNTVSNKYELNFCKQGIPQNVRVATQAQVNAAGSDDGDSNDSTYRLQSGKSSAGSEDCQSPTVEWDWDENRCVKGDAPSKSDVFGSLIYGNLRKSLPQMTAEMAASYGYYGQEPGAHTLGDPDSPEKNRAYKFGTSWKKTADGNYTSLYTGLRPGTDNNLYGPCDVVENGYLEVQWNYHYTFVRTNTTGWTREQINKVNNRTNALERQRKPLLVSDFVNGIQAGTTSTGCAADDTNCKFGYWYLDRLDWEYAGCKTDGTYPNLLGGKPSEITGVYSDTTGKHTYRFGPPSAASSISWGTPSDAHVSDNYATQTVESPSVHNPRDPRTGYIRCSVSTPGYTIEGDWAQSRKPGAGWGKNNTGPRIPADTGYIANFSFNDFSPSVFSGDDADCRANTPFTAPAACTLPAWSLTANYDKNTSWKWHSAWQNNGSGQDTVDNSSSVRVFSPRDTR